MREALALAGPVLTALGKLALALTLYAGAVAAIVTYCTSPRRPPVKRPSGRPW